MSAPLKSTGKRGKRKESPSSPKRNRLLRHATRHKTLFWHLHSIWALTSGGMVILVANERYGFVPWIILFLFLTWASTLFFSRTIEVGEPSSQQGRPRGLRKGVASYLTRVMYQSTLFFLLPFYWYSTVVGSLNIIFSALLLGLAVFSCLDLLFDRWIRSYPLFGLIYFATVAFGAINLLLPLLFPIDPVVATPVAAVVAVGSAVPLALRGSLTDGPQKVYFSLIAIFFLVLVIGLPRIVPPVPLRLRNVSFTSRVERTTLVPLDRLETRVSAARLQGGIFILAEVFAPSMLPTRVSLEWRRNGQLFRTSRDIQISAHKLGFRVWDGFHAESGVVPPGNYEVTFRTAGQRCFGVAQILVTPE